MKTIKLIFSLMLTVLLLQSCNSGASLQEYYVDNMENPDFIVLDIPSSILNVSEIDLTPEQKSAYHSVKKLNVLAYKLQENDTTTYETEKNKINAILKDDKYQELMMINSGDYKGVVKYLGTDDAIDEVIVFGSNEKMGFALVRVLGDDMRPENMIQLIQVIQKSNLDENGLGQLSEMIGSK